MADQQHLAILNKGLEFWNRWRQENPAVQPDLSGADLTGTNLSWANLSWANVGGANFSGANLSGVELTESQRAATLLPDSPAATSAESQNEVSTDVS